MICHGPWLLVSAGLAKGHTITSWPTLADDLRNAGATWKDAECVRDGSWVSSRKRRDRGWLPPDRTVTLNRSL